MMAVNGKIKKQDNKRVRWRDGKLTRNRTSFLTFQFLSSHLPTFPLSELLSLLILSTTGGWE